MSHKEHTLRALNKCELEVSKGCLDHVSRNGIIVNCEWGFPHSVKRCRLNRSMQHHLL